MKIKLHKKKLAIGIAFLVIGMLFPLFFTVKDIGIYKDLNFALDNSDRLSVLLAAVKLLVLNSVRGFPHYFGAFIIADAVGYSNNKANFFKPIVAVCLVPLIYLAIGAIYDIHYDFGIPAILGISSIIILDKMNFGIIKIIKKALMVGVLFTAYQCLDIIPMLSRYGFGRGETSSDIKYIANFMEMTDVLNTVGMIAFMLLFSLFLLLFVLILEENKLYLMSAESIKKEDELNTARIKVLENRTFQEMQNLVHDLKTPLAVVQALAGVMPESSKEKQHEYAAQIEDSVERMNNMISEILYSDRTSLVATDRLVNSVLSNISALEYAKCVFADEVVDKQYIQINSVLFIRAIVNLIENAYHAVDAASGRIFLRTYSEDENVIFEVADNGKGISEGKLGKIWERGFSDRESLGLGLNFVKKVVEQSKGEVTVESHIGKGTTVRILLPGSTAKEEKRGND